jgi:ketosteroid isomerase-like protein
MPPSDLISEAQAVIRSHEEFAMAGDLDGVLSNVADDIVALASGAPLVEGAEAFRDFYAGIMAIGDVTFGHDYSGAATAGDLVVLHGVSRGAFTTADGEQIPFENNFIHTLRRGSDGRLKVWRAAFAPAT